MNKWLQGLNPEQVQAVQHNHGPLLILAGAGSGKTTVLVSRTGRLIDESIALPKEICVLTFTNKAARELKHRVTLKVGSRAKEVWAGTFHSFGLQVLRRFHKQAKLSQQFGILDSSDTTAIVKELLKDVKNSTKEKFDADKLLELINEKRSFGKFKQIERDEYLEVAEVLEPKFVKKLDLLGVVDFEGLLLRPMQVFQEHPEVLEKVQSQFQQVMVDEFQDTNALQMKLIKSLVEPHLNLTVVGDDDQSIYGWRGAEVQNILNFPHDFKKCEVIRLERNYRSSASILALANEVISKNKTRHGKVLKAEKAVSDKVLPELFVLESEEEECEFVALEIQNLLKQGVRKKDIAVLYRSNTQGGLIESGLRRNQIDYTITGGLSIFDRKEVKDVMAYLRQALAPNEVCLRRIINTPPRGIGETSIEKIQAFMQEHKVTFFEACKRCTEIEMPEKAQQSLAQVLNFCWTLPERVINDIKMGSTPGERLINLMIDIGYKDYIQQGAPDALAAEKRWITIDILGRILDSYLSRRSYEVDTLKDFVDAMMLRDDVNNEEEKDCVQLMTLHASKGLEFPYVILAGVEEDLLPHRNLGSDIDEERRLFYVGITRAKERLILSRCQTRKRHGAQRPVAPSRFIVEVNNQLYQEYPRGVRPVTGEAREDLVSSFLSKLDSKLGASQK